jgi:hypothetical protein
MDFAQFQNGSGRRSVTDYKRIRAPEFSSYLVAMGIAAGLIFAWMGLNAI